MLSSPLTSQISSIGQEFYRWNLTTVAARAAGRARLQLLDYTYSFLQQHNVDGTPALWPLSWVHPEDANTIAIEKQFYYGQSLLVSPVVEENSTSVTIYVPATRYYDYFTLAPLDGAGAEITIDNVGYETMPLHIKGGSVVPLRDGESYTTGENRQLPFRLVVAPDTSGKAAGYLRLDDGESIDMGDAVSDIYFEFVEGCKLAIKGTFGYDDCNKLDTIVFAGQDAQKSVKINGKDCPETEYNAEAKTLTVKNLGRKLNCEMSVELS